MNAPPPAASDALGPKDRELVASLRRRLETGARHEKEVGLRLAEEGFAFDPEKGLWLP